jgi:ABC-type phosphate transport system substrate-binding protein
VSKSKWFAAAAATTALVVAACSGGPGTSTPPSQPGQSQGGSMAAGVTNLSTQQTQDIWTGKITNWSAVGGPNENIVLIIRPDSSGTRATFKKIVLNGQNEASGQALTEDSNGAVTTAVQNTPGSTSVIGFAYYQANKSGLNALQLDGVDANLANMANGTYKIQAFGHMYTKGDPTGLTKAFLDFMMTKKVQQDVAGSLFYAPSVDSPVDTPPDCVDGTITAGGSTALQPLVEAAAQAYTAACPSSTINVEGGGSGTGLASVASGAFDIGDSDIFAEEKLATPDAAALVDHQVVRQGWVMVTNVDVGPSH